MSVRLRLSVFIAGLALLFALALAAGCTLGPDRDPDTSEHQTRGVEHGSEGR